MPFYFKHTNHARIIHHRPFDFIQYFHDHRLVRSSQTTGSQNHHPLAPDRCYPLFMEHRSVRILRPGTGQPHRISGKRRSLLADAAESHPGSHHPDHFHHLFPALLQRRSPPLEPRCRLRLLSLSRIFRIYEIAASGIKSYRPPFLPYLSLRKNSFLFFSVITDQTTLSLIKTLINHFLS